MNLKKFEYLHKDVPFLKKDILFRAIFIVLFFAIFLIQLISMLQHFFKNTLELGMAISSGIVLLTSLLFCLISVMYLVKTSRIITIITKRGRCVSSVDILINTKKDGFVRLYSFVCEALALLATIVLVCSLTYSALEVKYYNQLSFYLPLLATICLTSFYSVFHLENELKTMQTVNNYHSIY